MDALDDDAETVEDISSVAKTLNVSNKVVLIIFFVTFTLLCGGVSFGIWVMHRRYHHEQRRRNTPLEDQEDQKAEEKQSEKVDVEDVVVERKRPPKLDLDMERRPSWTLSQSTLEPSPLLTPKSTHLLLPEHVFCSKRTTQCSDTASLLPYLSDDGLSAPSTPRMSLSPSYRASRTYSLTLFDLYTTAETDSRWNSISSNIKSH